MHEWTNVSTTLWNIHSHACSEKRTWQNSTSVSSPLPWIIFISTPARLFFYHGLLKCRNAQHRHAWNCSLYYNSNQANSPFTIKHRNEKDPLIVIHWCSHCSGASTDSAKKKKTKNINVFICVCTNCLLKAFLMQLKRSSALNCILLILRVHKGT